MYSYINPRKKAIISRATKMWLIFFIVMATLVLGYGIYLRLKASSLESKLEEQKKASQTLLSSLNGFKDEYKTLQMKLILAKEINGSNQLLKKSVKNLFNLVPDQIVLDKVTMKKDSLEIVGQTTTKDAYRLLLEPPLKSIFSSSEVNFEFDGRIGRYRFTSINKIEKEKCTDGKK